MKSRWNECPASLLPRPGGKLLLGCAKDAIKGKLSQQPGSEEWAYAGEGERYDPLEPAGRSATPLHSCGHARHLSQSEISKTGGSLAGNGCVWRRRRSFHHLQGVPNPSLGGRQ